jgi:hypothetical protein
MDWGRSLVLVVCFTPPVYSIKDDDDEFCKSLMFFAGRVDICVNVRNSQGGCMVCNIADNGAVVVGGAALFLEGAPVTVVLSQKCGKSFRAESDEPLFSLQWAL